MLKISDSCIRCGACADECPAFIITKGGIPTLTSPNECIKCGHCEAVCSKFALENKLLTHKEQDKKILDTSFDPIIVENILRARRSLRTYKDKAVPKEATEKLLKIGTFAQTGGNSQSVSYLVLSDKNKINQLRELTLNFYASIDIPEIKFIYESLKDSKRDRLFRGAPMMIFGLTPKGNDYVEKNASYALTYLELMAPSLGLATCWAGYLEGYTKTDSDDLRKLLDIPADLKISAALLFGYPKYKYHTLIERNELTAFWR